MIEKTGKKLNLKNVSVSVQDADPNSKFFVVTEFSDILTSGKNTIGFNGSDYLKPNSPISVEVLDVNGNALYTEIARTSDAIKYRDGVSIIVSIYVYSSTPIGTGEVIIVGYLKNGKKVRWQRNVNINSRIANTSKVRFYDTPEIEAKSILSDIFNYTSVSEQTASGSASSLAVDPIVNSNFLLFDVNRKQLDYRIKRVSGDVFTSRMEGFPITFSNINNTSASFESFVKEVLSENVLRVTTPYITESSSFNRVVSTFSFSNYVVTYVPPQTGFVVKSAGTGSDGQEIKYKQSLSEITLKNLKTFSGNPHRFRLYRKSLNSNFDSECIADELLEAREVIVDEANPNRSEENIGYFYSADHISRYWPSSSTSIIPSLSNDPLIDGMHLVENPVQPSDKFENRNYVIAKDYTVTGSRLATYIPYDAEQDLSGSGIAHDSNFIKLYKNVEYIFSTNIVGYNNNVPNSCGISFYLTSSQYSFSTSDLFDGSRIRLLDIKQTDVEKNYGLVETSFTLNENVKGTLVISPYGGDFIVSKVSIKPSQAFSFSPEILNIRVPFQVDVANSRYLIRSELFDANSNLIPVKLETTAFFDKYGESLTKVSSSIFSDMAGLPPGLSTFNFIDPTVNSIHVTTNAQIDGNLTVNGTANLTAQHAVSASYAISASYAPAGASISASYALTASYALNVPTSSVSSSHADTASFSFTSISSSHSETSSYSFTSVSASWAPIPATSSYALFSISSSHSETSSYSFSSVSASYAPVPVTSSYALTASYVELANTASYVTISQTSSLALSVDYPNITNKPTLISSSLQFTNSDNVNFGQMTASVLSASSIIGVGNAITGIVSSSHSVNSNTASYVTTAQTASYVLNSVSSSFSTTSQTASYVANALTSSYVQTAQTASFVQTAQTASYVLTSSYSVSSSNSITSSYSISSSNSISSSYASSSSDTLLTVTSRGATTPSDIYVGSLSTTDSGVITRSNGLVMTMSLSTGRTIIITRSGSLITSLTDSVKTWTYTRSGSNNQIISWTVT